jgi:hypothetical protein
LLAVDALLDEAVDELEGEPALSRFFVNKAFKVGETKPASEPDLDMGEGAAELLLEESSNVNA